MHLATTETDKKTSYVNRYLGRRSKSTAVWSHINQQFHASGLRFIVWLHKLIQQHIMACNVRVIHGEGAKTCHV